MSVVHAGGHAYEVRQTSAPAPSVPGDSPNEIVTITIVRDGEDVTSLDFDTHTENGMGTVSRDATIDARIVKRGARIEVVVREAWAIWCEPCDQQHEHMFVSTVITCGADGCSDAASFTIGLPPVP